MTGKLKKILLFSAFALLLFLAGAFLMLAPMGKTETAKAVTGTGTVDDPYLLGAGDDPSTVTAWKETDENSVTTLYIKTNAPDAVMVSFGMILNATTGAVSKSGTIPYGTSGYTKVRFLRADESCTLEPTPAMFYKCNSITDIVIPEFVSLCDGMLASYNGGAKVTTLTIEGVREEIPKGFMAAWPTGSVLKRLNSDEDGVFILPDGVETIGANGLVLGGAVSLYIPATLTELTGTTSAQSIRLSTAIRHIYFGGSAAQLASMPGYNFFRYGTDKKLYLNCTKEKFLNGTCEETTELDLTGMTSDSIANYAFYCCKYVTEITIPENVSSISSTNVFASMTALKTVNYNAAYVNSTFTSTNYLFKNCTALTTINVGKSVTYLPANIFYGNTSKIVYQGDYIPPEETLESIEGVTEDGVTYKEMNENPHYAVTAVSDELTSVTLHSDVKLIAANAFKDKTNLTSVTIPEGVIIVGGYAFSGCTGLTEITLPSTLGALAPGAFSGCTALNRIVLPENITDFYEYVFNGCSSLTGISPLVSRATTIGSYAFAGCTVNGSISINNVSTIGSYAFSGCTVNGSISINNVSTIGYYAFSSCTEISDIYITGDVEKVSNNAFDGCAFKTGGEVVLSPSGTMEIGTNSFAYWKVGSVSLKLEGAIILGEGTSNSTYGAFYDSDAIVGEVVVPDSVTCKSPKNFKSFNYCSGITRLVLGRGITVIYKLNHMDSLEELEFSDNLKSIADSSCANNDSLRSIVIPDSVTSIGVDAFSFCDSVTYIYLGKGLKTVGKRAFRGLSTVETLVYNCENVYIDSGTVAGPNGAFSETTLLSIVYGPDVETISRSSDGWGFPMVGTQSTIVYSDKISEETNSDIISALSTAESQGKTVAFSEAAAQNEAVADIVAKIDSEDATGEVYVLDAVLSLKVTATIKSDYRFGLDLSIAAGSVDYFNAAYVDLNLGGETIRKNVADIKSFALNGIEPTAMAEEIAMSFYDKDGGKICDKTYSLKEYLLAIKEKDSATYGTLVDSILNYGAAAQVQSGLEKTITDGDVVTAFSDEGPTAPTGLSSATDGTGFKDDKNNGFTGASLYYRDIFKIKFGIKLSTYTLGDVVIRLDGVNVNDKLEDAGSGRYYLTTREILPKDISTRFTITMEANGVVIATSTYGVTDYVYNIKNVGEHSQDMKNLVIAIWNMSVALNALS